MISGTTNFAGAGTQTSALAAGGQVSPTAQTQEFTGGNATITLTTS